MVKGNIWTKMPDTVLDRPIKEKYNRFVELAASKFMRDFKYHFPAHITPHKKIAKWLIVDKRMPLMKNILIGAIESAIAEEDLKIVSEEHEKTIEELREIIRVAQSDLDYISEKADEKAREELKHG